MILNDHCYNFNHLLHASHYIACNQIPNQPLKKQGIISILQVSKKAQTGEKPTHHTASEWTQISLTQSLANLPSLVSLKPQTKEREDLCFGGGQGIGHSHCPIFCLNIRNISLMAYGEPTAHMVSGRQLTDVTLGDRVQPGT